MQVARTAAAKRATEAWHAGGENGFSQAIELASDTLSNVKFVQEKRLISKFFDEISQDTGKYGFGVSETLQLMEMGAVETLVVWENLEVDRCILKTSTGEEVVKFLNKEAQQKSETYRCAASHACHALRSRCCSLASAPRILLIVQKRGLENSPEYRSGAKY